VRVIAGRLGGRRLKAPRGRRTRPTSDRVREAVFALLGEVDGARVLDLFAGAGGLGIEALSRGAAQAVFVEQAGAAVDVLRDNLSALALGPAEAQVRHCEALSALQSARRRSETYDLVFIDPPYDRAQGLERMLGELLPPLLGPGARVVVESDRRAPLRLALPLQRERIYGDTSIRIHRSDEPT
jgi:16S rRNA (guanine966-N2)-methyltransferase